MPLRDIFKKKDKPQKKEKEIKSPEAKKKEEIKVSKKQKIGTPSDTRASAKGKDEGKLRRRQTSSPSWRILKNLHITEKATDLSANNQYVFKVMPKANKTEVKKSIEDLYGVDVLGVRIIKTPGKRKRLGRISGWKSGYKKAVVKIKEGQKIEVLAR